MKVVKRLWKTMETKRLWDSKTFEHFHLKIGQINFRNKILFCWIANCSWYSGDSMSRWALSFLNSLTYYALANNLTFFEGQPAQHVAQHPHIWALGLMRMGHFWKFQCFFSVVRQASTDKKLRGKSSENFTGYWKLMLNILLLIVKKLGPKLFCQ